MSAKDREGVKKWSDITDIINEQTLCKDIKLIIIDINFGFDIQVVENIFKKIQLVETLVNFVGVFHTVSKTHGKNEWVHQKAGEILYKIHASHIPVENLSYASKIDLKV